MGDFQYCITVILAEEASLALGNSDTSARIVAEAAPRPLLSRGFDQLDILLQQLVDELADVDAPGLGASGQIGFHLGFQIHRQIQTSLGPVELAAPALGEIDLGGDVVMILIGLLAHSLHPIALPTGVRFRTAGVRSGWLRAPR